jgi:hypothetical protein
MERGSPEQHRPNFLELYPAPEDWDALQGGKPRVFVNPHNPKAPWEVVHVYDEHDDPDKRFHSGIIVQTEPPEKLQLLRKGVPRTDDTGRLRMKDIQIPSFMDRTVHGDVCNDRTAAVNGHGYERITSQRAYESYIAKLKSQRFVELRFGVSQNGFVLKPQPIRAPRPLDSPPDEQLQ